MTFKENSQEDKEVMEAMTNLSKGMKWQWHKKTTCVCVSQARELLRNE